MRIKLKADRELKLRRATIDDLDALTDIAVAAFPMDPQWNYRFPHRERYPDDHRSCTKEMYRGLLEEGSTINIVTTKIKSDSEEFDLPISLAVWQEMYKDSQANSSRACPSRRDANFKHMDAFDDALSEGMRVFFEQAYRNNQLHLLILGTHPDYQRHGAGDRHCKWGLSLAKKNDVPLTTFSSPMGTLLYKHLGFTSLGTVTVQASGEDEKLHIGVMAKEVD